MAPNERTPLIQVVPIAPPPDRYPHSRVRYFCSIVLAAVPFIVGLVTLLCVLLPPSLLPSADKHYHDEADKSAFLPWSMQAAGIPSSWPQTEGVGYEELQEILMSTPKEEKAREWSKYYTSGPHLAGKNLSQAIWTKEKWQRFGIPQTSIVAYDVYVNYPQGHRLALLEKEDEGQADAAAVKWNVKTEFRLEEDVLKEDGTSGLEDRVPTFHGYSASGNVTAPYVYVNYGTYADFDDLVKANVSLAGKIALIKYGRIFRGLKVKRAQELGMVGAIIYTDPGDDGMITDENGNKTYPIGPAREPNSVQRGSVQFLSIAPGDPTTPGYPSKPGVPRQPANHSTPSIPSIPISYLDALPLLEALNGHGPKASSFNKYWQGGGLGYKGVKYNIGPSPDNLAVNLVNEQEYVTTPMWNVIGVVNGTMSDEVVILGNHRDAWIAGGAGDPNSGSAAFNEVIRSIGKALEAGWKPLRTIVFASWDGEEYGLIGSTEWVEEYLPWLSASAIAYLNVDVGTTGPHFKASAAPLLNKALIETVGLVQSPNQTVTNQTIGDVWNGHISTMGSGSDFTAFQDFAGIPCIDMGFSFGQDTAVYHYHSNYDSFDWMEKFGDPGWHYHVAIAKVWALLAAKIIETPVLQLNATDYAIGLKGYLEDVKEKIAKEHGFLFGASTAETGGAVDEFQERHMKKIFGGLDKALSRFYEKATDLDESAAELLKELQDSDIPWWKWWKKVQLYYRVQRVNSKYKYLERKFLYAPGLDGRSWFKHVVFAPGIWTGYSGATFPGVVEAIDAGERGAMYKWIGIITGLVEKAASSLE